jgi:hypothetical protein
MAEETPGSTPTPPAGTTPAAQPPSPAPGDATGSPGTPAGGTPPAPAPEAQKPAEGKPALTDAQSAPELKFESIKIPEGVKLEGETKDAFAKAITEGDPNKRAQALLDLYAGEAKKAQEGAFKTFQDMNKQWVDSVKSDPEIGGDNWANVQKTIAKGLDTFGTPGVRQALNLTGAGNNPDVIKTFYKMAKALSEGGHVSGNPPAQGGERSLPELMYPTMKGSA